MINTSFVRRQLRVVIQLYKGEFEDGGNTKTIEDLAMTGNIKVMCKNFPEHFIVFEVYIRTTGIGLFGKFLHQPGFANLAGSKHNQRLSVVACFPLI